MNPLQAGNVALRPPEYSDKFRLAELCNNKKIWDNVRDSIPFPYTISDAEYFIGLCRDENPPMTFIIEYHNEVAGVIGLVKQTDVYRLTAEIGYWVGEPFWGKKIATTAVKLITGYGFDKLMLVRIFTGVFEHNIASQRVLTKAGFKLEGIFENSVVKNGEVIDEYRYALINPLFI
ncbi:MAG: GNAT family N-acetyltransferase [Bacteroidales bacterium]|nr:GNAT family N-acetyltransferase [Bacteroidales bacterium]